MAGTMGQKNVKSTKPAPSAQYFDSHMKFLYQSLVHLLAFTTEDTQVDTLVQSVIQQLTPEVYDPLEDILLKGDECSGIYFIVDGSVSVVTEDGDGIITTLTSGQFFGEVSTIYRIPVTARVRAQTRCECLLLKKTKAWSILPNAANRVDVLDWFVAKKYIPTSGVIDCGRTYRRMLLYTLQELPLFQSWSQEGLKRLILTMSSKFVILYPAKSYISCIGDPCDVIHVILRGRSVITGKSGLSLETTSYKFPILIGEAGMVLDRPGVLNVRTLCECQVVSIRLDQILQSMQEESSKCKASWDKRRELWEDFYKRKEDLEHVPEESIQYEVLFQHLSNSSLFRNSGLPLLHHLARESNIIAVASRDLAYTEQDAGQLVVLLVVEGRLELELGQTPGHSDATEQPPRVITRGQMIAKYPNMPAKMTYRSVGRSFVIKYSTALLKQTLVSFSKGRS